MPVTAGIYFAEIPSAMMKMERNLRMMTKTRRLMRVLQKKTLMLKSSSKVRTYELWLCDSFTDHRNQ